MDTDNMGCGIVYAIISGNAYPREVDSLWESKEMAEQYIAARCWEWSDMRIEGMRVGNAEFLEMWRATNPYWHGKASEAAE